MVRLDALSAAMLLASITSMTLAHPEHHEMEEALALRNTHAAIVQRGLSTCASHPNYLALQKRATQRRWEKAQKLRQKRGISQALPYRTRLARRDEAFDRATLAPRDLAALEAFEEVNHNMTSLGYSESTDSSTLFASYKNSSCILTPEVTVGPYYVTGEYFRTDIVDGQSGVPVHLEYQYIDINTCDVPTDDIYIESWQANATGVYSGVQASGNGNDADASNLNSTFLRGITKIDSDGVGAFDTLFVGHYADRASHVHVLSHVGGTVYANGTFQSSNIAHVGQLFFDTDLKDVVEATSPYNENTQAITTNDEDMWAPDQADNNYDPFPDYAYLGSDISDGLLMWISIGINTSATYTVSPAGALTANGGTVNGDSALSSGGGGGFGGGNSSDATGNGTMPSGGMGGSMGGSAQSGSIPSGSIPSGSGSMGSASSSKTTTSAKVFSSSSKKSSTKAHTTAILAHKKTTTTTTNSVHKKTTTTQKKKTTSVPAKKHSTTANKKKTTTSTHKKNTTTTTHKKKPTTTTHKKKPTTTTHKKKPTTTTHKKQTTSAHKAQKQTAHSNML